MGIDGKVALYWEPVKAREADGETVAPSVHCLLCPKDCRIAPGKVGFCRVRKNVNGTLVSLNYGRVVSCALDPSEKKPLYHFYPGSYLFSMGALGCNFACGFCQNWQISQADAPTAEILPRTAVEMTLREKKKTPSVIGIAYTYSEPLVWYEYVTDTSKMARENGLKNVLVTNGFIREEPLRELLPLIDAMNVDVKGFSGDFYKKVCSGRIEPVLRTVEMAVRAEVHVEVTTLLVPGENDDSAEIESLVSWLSALSPDIPLHFSRYFPNYKYTTPPTPVSTLKRAREIASKKLRYVYIGNVWDPESGVTYCPRCGHAVIKRVGMGVSAVDLTQDNRCKRCGGPIAIVGSAQVTE